MATKVPSTKKKNRGNKLAARSHSSLSIRPQMVFNGYEFVPLEEPTPNAWVNI